MSTSRTKALILVAILASTSLGLLFPGASGSAPQPATTEGLRNGSLEGQPTRANGFEIAHQGAELSLVANDGVQSINLGRTGATAQPSGTLGLVRAFTAHDLELRHIRTFHFSYSAPRGGDGAHLNHSFLLDLDHDGTADACIAHRGYNVGFNSGWVRATLDGAKTFQTLAPDCTGSSTTRTLTSLQSDATWRTARVLAYQIESVAPTSPWGAFPIYVDRLSILAASNPLVRIQAATDNLCDGASFSNIADGLACAADGATLLVAPGTHTGSLILNKPVTLCATAPSGTACEDGRTDVIVRGTSLRAITIEADDVTIRGLTIENPQMSQTDSSAGGPIDPTLIHTTGERITILKNTLRDPAQALGIGQTRTATLAIHVAAGADVRIENNHIHNMPASLGTSASCPDASCRTTGILVSSGIVDAHVEGNQIDMTGAGRATGIAVRAHDAIVKENWLVIPAGTTNSPSIGILAMNAQNVRLEGNAIRGGDEGFAFGGATLKDATLRDNFLRDVTTLLKVRPSTSGATIDARENDWGIYRHADIKAALADSGTGNTLDVTCYIDANGVGIICPPTIGFSWSPETPSWGRKVLFTDETVTHGRDINRRIWTFGDGESTFQQNPFHVYGTPGEYVVSFFVSDNDGHQVWLNRTITIINRAPVIAPVGPLVVVENSTLAFNLNVTDPDLDHPTVTLHNAPANAIFDANNHSFTWSPNFTQAGNYTLTFSASDGLETTFLDIDIEVVDVNAPPILERIGNLAINEGEDFYLYIRATDDDAHQTLKLRLFVRPSGSTWIDYGNGTGLFRWKPTHTQAGLYALTAEVDDGIKEIREQFVLTVLDVNRPPVIFPIPNHTVQETKLLNFFVSGSDADGDAITYGVTTKPWNAKFHPAERRFEWTPNHDQEGIHRVVFTLTDGIDLVERETFIHVTKMNRAPYLHQTSPQYTVANRTWLFQVNGADPDGDAIHFGMLNVPENATFNNATRVFTWRPSADQVGVTHLVFTVTDGELVGHMTVAFTVHENKPPVITMAGPEVVDNFQSASYTATGTYDPEKRGAIRYEWDFDASDGFTAQRTGLTVNWAWQKPGNYTITVRAIDADNFWSTKTLNVTVDDTLMLSLNVIEQPADLETATLASAYLRLSDGTPAANTTIKLVSSYQPIATAPPSMLREFTVRTGEDGRVTFFIPRDLTLINLPGRHVLEGQASVPTSLNDDEEHAHTTIIYTTLLG